MLIPYGDALVNTDHILRVGYVTLPVPELTLIMSDGQTLTCRGADAVREHERLRRLIPPEPDAATAALDAVADHGRRLDAIERWARTRIGRWPEQPELPPAPAPLPPVADGRVSHRPTGRREGDMVPSEPDGGADRVDVAGPADVSYRKAGGPLR